MVSTYEMFSPSTRHQAAYGLSQNYGHQTTYAQYTDSINFNSCNAQSIMENSSYPQNFHNSWSLYAVSANNQPRSHMVPLDEWMPLTTNPCSYQGQGIVQFPADSNTAYHYQRNGSEMSPADYSLQSPGHMRVQEKIEQGVVSTEPLENPSSESVVAVSSDGMSGTDSPVNMPLHVNQSGNGLFRPQPARSPFEWIRKTSYQQSQPNPGRTRTKDKYRIVYTDHQRLELEKEFHYSRYITIRRKVELASSLNLSERQIKIWFQNRRAKDRRQAKKREELMLKNKDTPVVYQQSNISLGNLSIY
ncbi:homeobox protein CDX-1-like isoform X2 [Argiope bruennichi]|uniref:Homeobox protein CHOX-CAD like protein n=1 Tax=Argiope bruennichi TaxID=94029 RepID=A0A8T0E6D3_ARGBR|nr:homeobox protein CDX-1-like isoform X2 [Argiope bruennichi]KAF8767409.1 Homeobox protein CHOX-CAD like protein [Argiope bruennichi]